MTLLTIDTETCNQDGICAAVCPAGIIDFKKGAFPEPSAHAEEICIRCGHCVAVCPTGSLSHRVMGVDQCPPIQEDLCLSEAQCEQFLRARRSIRRFKEKPVPREEIIRLIDLARYAPTGHNVQNVKWLAMGTRAELDKLAGLTVDWMRWMVANEKETAQALHLEETVQAWEAGHDVILRQAPVVIVTHAPVADMRAPTSSTIALTYLTLAATSLGLGTCWAGYFGYAAASFPPLKETLALPEGHQTLGAMMVGYPKYRYQRLPTRKRPEIVWRW
jgi:nitroreductase/NAD-dependent dihydropyrimidine dehydrogenase PreA subunit